MIFFEQFLRIYAESHCSDCDNGCFRNWHERALRNRGENRQSGAPVICSYPIFHPQMNVFPFAPKDTSLSLPTCWDVCWTKEEGCLAHFMSCLFFSLWSAGYVFLHILILYRYSYSQCKLKRAPNIKETTVILGGMQVYLHLF